MRGELSRKVLMVLELLVVFVALPLIAYLGLFPFHELFLLLLMGSVYAFILLRDKDFDKRRLGINGFRDWKGMLLRFMVFALLSLPLLLAYDSSFFDTFWYRNWLVWLLIMMLYPLFSVLPQAVVYRLYFFHRFKKLFKNDFTLMVINALLFSFLHLIYRNWLALVLTFIGAFVFASTYLKSKSLVATWAEHAIYGDFLFLIGLGGYFS